MDGVVLLGRLPRPSLDRGMIWKETEAFRLDPALCTLVRERLGPRGTVFVQVAVTYVGGNTAEEARGTAKQTQRSSRET